MSVRGLLDYQRTLMSYISRALEDRWLETAQQFPAVLLTGPRQVGKTTLLRHLCGPERRYVSLDDLALRELARADPTLFLQRFPPPVLIDEIQYAPQLLPHVKLTIDQQPQAGGFWLTGSQQFAMMRGITESLAGRVAIVQMLGLSSRERDGRDSRLSPFLPSQEILDQRRKSLGATSPEALFEEIWTGSFPALVSGQVTDRDLFYSSYVQTYLQRDVRDLAQVGDQAAFLRFLRATAARTGQLLNLSDLARDVDVAVNTAKSWLSILEASLQICLLRPYHDNLSKRLVKTPKLYFLDTGLCSYFCEWSSPATLAAGAMAGAMLETWVLSEILKSYWHRLREPRLYFFRDRDQKEIDFLFERDGTLYPVEVKRAATPRRDWLRSFATLQRLSTPVGPGAVVCLTPSPVPLSAAVEAVPAGLL